MAKSFQEPLIEFVPCKQTDEESVIWGNKNSQQFERKATLNGDEVHNFYEGLISEKANDSLESSQLKINKKVAKKADKSVKVQLRGKSESSSTVAIEKGNDSGFKSNSKERTTVRLLQKCQDGSVDDVVKCLRQGADINVQDQFGWTPLMCSAFPGHNQVVKILLKSGADWTLCEKSGKTARDLAVQNKQKSTVEVMDDLTVKFPTDLEEASSPILQEDDKGFYCDVCKKTFTEGTFKAHTSSTVHLFNRQLKPQQPSYLISESNVGYQMMLRSGWNRAQGLGPRGEGHKYPVKTLLKRDREGFGKETKCSPRVTHFKPRDTDAVKSAKPRGERKESVRTASRKAMKRREHRNREWEIRLRQYMNSE